MINLDEPTSSWVMPLLMSEFDRVVSLRSHAILDSPNDPELDLLVRSLAEELGFPIARLTLIDSDREWTKSAYGTRFAISIPRSLAFCAHTILNPSVIMVIPDATLDVRFANNPFVCGDPGIRFYAGSSLTDKNGRVLGAISVLDTRARVLDADGIARLAYFAGVASSRLDFYRQNAPLRELEDHYRSAVDLNPQIPFTALPDGSVNDASPRWLELTGMSHERARGAGWMEAVHPDDLMLTNERWAAALCSGEALDTEYRLQMRDKTYRWFRVRAAPRRGEGDAIIRWYGTIEDIHDRKVTTNALQESEHRLRHALEVGGLGAWEYDVASQCVTASDLCARTFGFQRGEELPDYDTVLKATHPDDRKTLNDERAKVLTGKYRMDVEFRTVMPDGSIRWIRLTGRAVFEQDGRPKKAYGLVVDVTEKRLLADERERARARLAHLAHHDTLTDLANRRLLDIRLGQALAIAHPQSKTALMCIDLDEFKATNDRLGNEAGDWLLRQIADRLVGCVRPCDTVARSGGDEFTVLATNLGDNAQVEILAARVLQAVSEPLSYDGHYVALGGSIGVAVAPNGLMDAAQLRRNADTALDRARRNGGGSYKFYLPEMDLRLQERRTLKAGFSDALEQEELRLFYQPLIDLEHGSVAGFEALMRWQHPQRGLIAPDDFVPIAEESGWIVRFGEWALRTACLEATRWPNHIRVAVNLSVMQFASGDLPAQVRKALDEASLAPDRLELEVTETLLLRDSQANLAVLQDLQSIGVRLAMDDFGTGYSSLAYLRRFRFNKLKIDKSLVVGLPDADGGDTIVRAIVGLGRSLGITVTAEGIENEAQLGFLRSNGCTQGQGYYFSRPLPHDGLCAVMDRTFFD